MASDLHFSTWKQQGILYYYISSNGYSCHSGSDTDQYSFSTWVCKLLLQVGIPAAWFRVAQSDASCAHGVCPGARWSCDAFLCWSGNESHYLWGQCVVIAVTYTCCTAKQLLGMWDSCSAAFTSHFTHLFSPPNYYMVLCLIIFSFAGKRDLQNISVWIIYISNKIIWYIWGGW